MPFLTVPAFSAALECRKGRKKKKGSLQEMQASFLSQCIVHVQMRFTTFGSVEQSDGVHA